jgi:hypothetical protein
MPHYTRRLTWPDKPESKDDYVFRCDGIDVGRCYLRGLTAGESKWWWTIFIALGPGTPRQRVEGIPIQGSADKLELAQEAFKLNFDKMIAAGVVSAPR